MTSLTRIAEHVLAENGAQLVVLLVGLVVDDVLAALDHQVRIRLAVGVRRVQIVALYERGTFFFAIQNVHRKIDVGHIT